MPKVKKAVANPRGEIVNMNAENWVVVMLMTIVAKVIIDVLIRTRGTDERGSERKKNWLIDYAKWRRCWPHALSLWEPQGLSVDGRANKRHPNPPGQPIKISEAFRERYPKARR